MEIINNRAFHKGNSKYVFDRYEYRNYLDLVGCAALAMNKAIIGICQLDLLEQAENQMQNHFRSPKAIQVYIIIYHLFTCCMLLDNDYEIFYKRKPEYGTPLHEMRYYPSQSKDWNQRKKIEIDLATRITHSDIKRYCEALRTLAGKGGLEKKPLFIQSLFHYFVDEECASILYEKADYIRDRSLYRPSHIASMTDAPIQTSKNIRKQIDSLPSSSNLFQAICKIQQDLHEGTEEFISHYKVGLIYPVDCDTEHLTELGYTWTQLQEMGADESFESVPSFVFQLMELYSPEQTIIWYERYWKPFLDIL